MKEMYSSKDFSADATNSMADKRKFSGSGLTAGVQSGLSEVVSPKRGDIPAQMKSSGNDFRRVDGVEPAGEKMGKNFQFKV
jgi:hypothetical protein